MTITRHDIAEALGKGWDVVARSALLCAYHDEAPVVARSALLCAYHDEAPGRIVAELPNEQTPELFFDGCYEDTLTIELSELDIIRAGLVALGNYIADHYDEVLALCREGAG